MKLFIQKALFLQILLARFSMLRFRKICLTFLSLISVQFAILALALNGSTASAVSNFDVVEPPASMGLVTNNLGTYNPGSRSIETCTGCIYTTFWHQNWYMFVKAWGLLSSNSCHNTKSRISGCFTMKLSKSGVYTLNLKSAELES